MNKRLRSMIDELFSQMKMTAENLALRDELMANAQARYEDAMGSGASEEEAFAQIAASLEDVQGLLDEMSRMDAQPKAATETARPIPELKTGTEQEAAPQAGPEAEPKSEMQTDLGDALNKAFTALGDFSQAIMPEAKKLYGQVDDVTGGVLGKLGRAAKKGMRDAQKAAGEALDKMSRDGELVFDFGGSKPAAPEQPEAQPTEDPAEEPAQEAAAQAKPETQPEPKLEETVLGADGEVDEDALARAVDRMAQEAEQVIHQAEQAARDAAGQARREDYIVRDANEPVSGRRTFPAAGLHALDIQLDADEVKIELAQGHEIETLWEAQNVDGEPVITMEGHTLTIRRKNPDVFKTFFSVFQTSGGRITVRVPHGYAAAMKVSTTSGDVHIAALDAGDVKVNTTSGDVRVEPDARVRAGAIDVTTVSGCAAVSACADMVNVTTVSGGQFISCDAHKVDVNAVSGDVHIEGACEEWEIDAVSADVELLCTVVPTKRIQISTMSGSARLALPEDIRGFAAEIKGAFGSEIVNEFGANRYGTCGLPIRMDTMSGKLMITRL